MIRILRATNNGVRGAFCPLDFIRAPAVILSVALLRLRLRRGLFLASGQNSLAHGRAGAQSSPRAYHGGAAGFSLVEVMIVIALIALISAVAIPSLSNVFRSSRDEFARHMALTLREARDRAMLQNKLLRLRIDFDNQQYWFEEAPGNYLKPKADDKNLSEREKEEQKKADGGAFREVTELAKERMKVPKGLKLTEVISPRAKQPLREGIADVYFYDNGNTDGAVIHFEDEEKTRQAIKLHPITGLSKITAGYEEGKP